MNAVDIKDTWDNWIAGLEYYTIAHLEYAVIRLMANDHPNREIREPRINHEHTSVRQLSPQPA